MTAPTPDVLALLEATLDAVVIMDDRGRIQAFNASAEEMFGYRAADAIGRNVSMLMTVDRPPAAMTITSSATWPAASRAMLGKRPRRARAASRRQRVLGVPERRADSEHRSAAVRRLSARHVACAARRWPRSKTERQLNRLYLDLAQVMLVATDRARRRATGQSARHPRAQEERCATSSSSNWIDSCVAPGGSRRRAHRVSRAAHERRRRTAELRVSRARRPTARTASSPGAAWRCAMRTTSPPASCSRARTSPTSAARKARRTRRSSA